MRRCQWNHCPFRTVLDIAILTRPVRASETRTSHLDGNISGFPGRGTIPRLATKPDQPASLCARPLGELLNEGGDIDPHVLARDFAVPKLQKVQDPDAGAPLPARRPQDAPHYVSRPNGFIDHEVVTVKPAHRLDGPIPEIWEKALVILAGGFPAPHLAAR